MPMLDLKLHDRDHHKHGLFKFNSGRYICDGCKEPGFGCCYCCTKEKCNFVLHEQCMQKFGKHQRFNRFPGCDFTFEKWVKLVTREANGTSMSHLATCDVCAKPINGYAYTSRNDGGRYIHPPCATLSCFEVNGINMKLERMITSKCVWCDYVHLPDRRDSWAYISTSDPAIEIHVGCLKDILVECSGQGSNFSDTLISGNSSFGVTLIEGNSNQEQPSFSNSTPSNSYSTAIVPYMQTSNIEPRKRDRIKKYAKTIGHAIAATLGSFSAIASLGGAIANFF